MKTLTFTTLMTLLLIGTNATAQKSGSTEKYGTTLNAGVGLGYYGYIGHSTPVLHADLELDVAKNFTLAPFITYLSYTNYYYWGNNQNPYRNYKYKQTVMPVGLKGTYYFDKALGATSKWDFYLAGSLGFAIRKTVWEEGYYGDYKVEKGTSGLYLDGHIGTEYHLSSKAGIFLDLSTGISTVGVAIHL